MKLFVIRHTEAIDYETESVRTDESRFITPNGRRISLSVFKTLRDDLSDLEKIFTSPLIRAVQTAEILASSLKYKNDVEISNELKPNSEFDKVIKLIKRNSIFKSIALVGHEPMLGRLVAEITNKETLPFEFKKNGVCYIDYDAESGQGQLKWYFDPKLLEKIA